MYYKIRVKRLLVHIFLPVRDPFLKYKLSTNQFISFLIHYLFEIPLLMLDVACVPEMISVIQTLTKRSSRKLTVKEKNFAAQIFKDSLDLDEIRIDENSHLGTHGGKYAFVMFRYINCQGRLLPHILIHEMVHVLQYIQSGSPYAFRNMVSHLQKHTYNYGGLDTIKRINANPESVHGLNYEQRADIFSDFTLLIMGQCPQWGMADVSHFDEYRQVVQLLLK